jgi:hypothetical protein
MQFHLTLSPAQREYILKPGATFTQAYQVTNNSNSTLVLNTVLEPWAPQGTDGSLRFDQYLQNPHLEFSLSNADLRLGQNFKLSPGQSRQLVLKIKALPQATPTDAYYTFFVYQDQNSLLNSEISGSSTSAKIGSNLILTISNSDQISSKATFSQLETSPLFKDALFGQITLSGQINNLSPHYFQTGGKITLSKSGLTQKELTIFPQNVLANHSRDLLCQDISTPPGPTSCTIPAPLWPGYYTATFTLDSPATTASLSFFVFPYWLFLALIFIFAGFFTIINKKRPSTP